MPQAKEAWCNYENRGTGIWIPFDKREEVLYTDRLKATTRPPESSLIDQVRPADDAATHPGRPPGSEVQPVRGRRTTASPSVLPPAEAPSGSGGLHLPAGAPSGRLGSV